MDKDTEEFEGGAGGSSISADLIRGHINTIILRSLYDTDKYGYEIINEINEKSHGQYTLKQPTLYSALKRLENQGYIQAYWKHDEVSAGGRRKYFRLTESGRKIAETNRAEWEYSRTVIDNLISDRNFDFSQPAPTPVDFKILKQATSRVPVVHNEDGENDVSTYDEATTTDMQNAPEENLSTRREMTLVAGTSDTVYVEDPFAPKIKTDNLTNESVANPAYNSGIEKELSYSKNIFSDGMPHSGDYPAGSKQTTQPQTSVAESSSARFAQPLITPKENTTAKYPQSPTAETNKFTQSPITASNNAPVDFKMPPTAGAKSTYGNFTHPPIPQTRSAPQNFTQSPTVNIENSFTSSTAREDRPIYSLPSQSYAQTGGHRYSQPILDNEVVQNRDQYYEGESTPEERRIAHENYMRLIAGDIKHNERRAEYEGAKNLVYNLQSEQERDYKNLIGKLFDNTINNEPTPDFQSRQSAQQQETELQPDPKTEPPYERTNYTRTSFFDAGDKAAADGLKISTSDEAFAAGSAKQTTYNKGATLFKCSLIVGVIVLLEFTLIQLFREKLNISLSYPIVILVLGMALVLVCGILYGAKYGIKVRKPTNLRYIMTMVIITILVIAIIFIAALIMNVNWTDNADILAKIILPCIIALNIPIFTLSFYLFTK